MSHERHKQAILVVIEAFLIIDRDEDVAIQPRGVLAELMCKVELGLYHKFIRKIAEENRFSISKSTKHFTDLYKVLCSSTINYYQG